MIQKEYLTDFQEIAVKDHIPLEEIVDKYSEFETLYSKNFIPTKNEEYKAYVKTMYYYVVENKKVR